MWKEEKTRVSATYGAKKDAKEDAGKRLKKTRARWGEKRRGKDASTDAKNDAGGGEKKRDGEK